MTSAEVCPNCGRSVPTDALFCAGCGQHLESTPAPSSAPVVRLGSQRYVLASRRRRLSAFLVDWFLLGTIGGLLLVGAGGGLGRLADWSSDDAVLVAMLAGGTISFVVQLALESRGWTPGKGLLGLRIVRSDGNRPGPVHGLARVVSRSVEGATLGLGLAWALWDPHRQTWHDKAADTFVVRIPQRPDAPARLFTPSEGGGPAVSKGYVWVSAFAGLGAYVALTAAGVWLTLWAQGADLRLPGEFRALHVTPSRAEMRGGGAEPRPNSCPGEGPRVCLVAIDSSAAPQTEELVRYISAVEEIQVGVLPPISLHGSELFTGQILDETRGQLATGGLLELLEATYPRVWQDPESALIAVTHYDLYDPDREALRFQFNARSTGTGRAAVISSARLDEAAYGFRPEPDLALRRLRKLLLREVGLVHYGFALSEDRTSVLYRAINSVDDLDLMTESLPRLPTVGAETVITESGRTYNGSGRFTTPHLALGAAPWEFCARIEGASTDGQPGVRVYAYRADGWYLAQDSGQGAQGDLGCVLFTTDPGDYYFRVFALEDVRWQLAVRRFDPTAMPPVDELPEWSSAHAAIPPAPDSTPDRYVFRGEDSEVTSLMELPANWMLCWTLTESPTAAFANEVDRFSVSVLFEDDDEVGEWTYEGAVAGDSDCIDVEYRQPGRFRLFMKESMNHVRWELQVAP